MNERLRTFRDGIREISPPWLRRGNAEKILYVVGYHLDAMIDQTIASVKLRFPGLYSNESLPFISRDRRMIRGLYEGDSGFADRLLGWWDAHRRRGNPYTLLKQIHAYFAPNNFPVQLIYASGRRYSMDTEGNITWGDIEWTPPGDPERWARWWLFYQNPEFIADVNWDDPDVKWDSGYVWDCGLPPAQVNSLRLIPDAWNAAHPFGKIVLLDEGEDWNTYTPGEWPRQIGLTSAMTDPIVPSPANDIATIVPPEAGLPVAAAVVHTAFQKIANSLQWLANGRAWREARSFFTSFEVETLPENGYLTMLDPAVVSPPVDMSLSGDSWVLWSSGKDLRFPKATADQPNRGIYEIRVDLYLDTTVETGARVDLIVYDSVEGEVLIRPILGVKHPELSRQVFHGVAQVNLVGKPADTFLRVKWINSSDAEVVGSNNFISITRLGDAAA